MPSVILALEETLKAGICYPSHNFADLFHSHLKVFSFYVEQLQTTSSHSLHRSHSIPLIILIAFYSTPIKGTLGWLFPLCITSHQCILNFICHFIAKSLSLVWFLRHSPQSALIPILNSIKSFPCQLK